jgi:hypothetical protein
VREESNRCTRGGSGDFRRARVPAQGALREQWRRWRWRNIWWEPGRPPKTRGRTRMALGLEGERARQATATGLGAWGNAGAAHLHAAVNHRVLATWGLRSLLEHHRARPRSTCTAVYGPVRPVVWGDGKGDLPSHPIT